MVTQETRIRELQILCVQLQEQKSSEYERVQEILQVCQLSWIGYSVYFYIGLNIG